MEIYEQNQSSDARQTARNYAAGMGTVIGPFIDVRERAADLGCAVPEGFALLPRNFETATRRGELVHDASGLSVRAAWRADGVEETRLEPEGETWAAAQKDAAEWIGPIIFVGSALLSQNPDAVNVGLGVVANYATDLLRGLPRERRTAGQHAVRWPHDCSPDMDPMLHGPRCGADTLTRWCTNSSRTKSPTRSTSCGSSGSKSPRPAGGRAQYASPMATRRINLPLDEELIRRARDMDSTAPEKSDAQVVEDALAVYLGMKALEESRALGTLPPDEADRLAVEEVRAYRKAQRRRAT
jgi:hypothetical protein